VDLHTLSICTGYGGIELGLRAVVPRIRTVCYVENEISQQQIVASRIKDGGLDDAPIWTDLRTFDASAFSGRVHLITGGFPCQPHSLAGKRLGEDDPRELSGQVLRIADELGRPTLFLENVPGIKRFYWDNIRPKLQEMGYRTEEVLVSAKETSAPHVRERLFILANAGYPDISGWLQEARDKLADSINSGDGRGYQRLQPEDWAGRPDGTAQVKGSNSTLADSKGNGFQESKSADKGQRSQASSTLEPTGKRVLNTSGTDVQGHDEPDAKERREEATNRRREGNADMVNPIGGGTQVKVAGQHPGEQQCDKSSEAVVNGFFPLPLYPPFPEDTDSWSYVLSQMPAVEPSFCRVAYGPTPWLDKRLRSIGNGVVPASAARAFTLLVERFGS